jgi:hypothetical protein
MDARVGRTSWVTGPSAVAAVKKIEMLASARVVGREWTWLRKKKSPTACSCRHVCRLISRYSTCISKLGNYDISLWAWHRTSGIGFPSSSHPTRTVHIEAGESRASRSIALRTANRLEFSAKLSSTPPAYKTIHQQPLKATRTSEMSETLAALPDAPRIQFNRNDVGRS